MKMETLANLVGVAVWAAVGLGALIGAIFFGAWWHFFTAFICLGFALMLLFDDDYAESAMDYLKRAKKNR